MLSTYFFMILIVDMYVCMNVCKQVFMISLFAYSDKTLTCGVHPRLKMFWYEICQTDEMSVSSLNKLMTD